MGTGSYGNEDNVRACAGPEFVADWGNLLVLQELANALNLLFDVQGGGYADECPHCGETIPRADFPFDLEKRHETCCSIRCAVYE